MTYKILLPVDGSEQSLHAAQYIVNLSALIKSLEVFIINVQPAGDDWMVGRMIKPEELARLEKEWSDDAMIAERDVLQTAGIVCHIRMAQGDVAPAVVRLASELSCQQIIMGVAAGSASLGERLLGSVVTDVLHLSTVPVTFVK